MPDSEGTVTSAVDGGDTAVLEVTWNGTFTGPWATPQGDVEPTGKQQTSRACVVLRQYSHDQRVASVLRLDVADAAARHARGARLGLA
jgi:hypothetical protein